MQAFSAFNRVFQTLRSTLAATIFALVACLSSLPAFAEDYEIPDWQVPGDGKTPTFLQHLDVKGTDAKETAHLAGTTPKGDGTYSHELKLPPALLKPTLAVSYSSSAGVDMEMPYGWKLDGIMEIRRPLTRAYAACRKKTDCDKAEWLFSGAGTSGTLKPSGDEAWKFQLRAASPVFVTAIYSQSDDSWTVRTEGVTYQLTAQDRGAKTVDGTALWRVTQAQDAAGNAIIYNYDSDGRIDTIFYGGNLTTGEDHLITVSFTYDDNAAVRTNARAGFVVRYDKHVTKIVVKQGEVEGSGANSAGSLANPGGINLSANASAGSGSSADTGDRGKGAAAGSRSGRPGAIGSVGKAGAGRGPGTSSGPGSSPVDGGATNSSGPLGDNAHSGVRATAEDGQLYAYDLIFTVKDSLDLLTKLQREGTTSMDVETIATFEYSKFK